MSEFAVNLLTPLSGKIRSKPVIGFDVETYGPENDFDIGVISTPEGDFFFDDASQMLSTLSSRKYLGHHIFATNLAFDAFAIFQGMNLDEPIPPGWEAFDNGAKLIYIRKQVRSNPRKYCYLLDSLNLFTGSVEQMGKILGKAGFPVGKMDKPEWLGMTPFTELNEEQKRYHIDYCAMDARVTRLFMQWLQSEINNLGANMRMTTSSTAMDLFRRRYLKAAIPQPDMDCMIACKQSYFGGRTEDFVKGRVEPCVISDINSMYPDAMLRTQYPYPSPERFTKHTNPPESCLEYEGITKCDIFVPKMHVPPLPYKYEGKLLFPIGNLTGVWTNLELRYAISLGCDIRHIHWSYFTSKTFNPFAEYVDDIYSKRMEMKAKRMQSETVMKLMMNGLYGKTAQNWMLEADAAKYGLTVKKQGGTFVMLSEATPEQVRFTADNYPHYLARNIAIAQAIPKIKAFMNPILASYTTAASRIKIHRFCHITHEEGCGLAYTDTDSIYSQKAASCMSHSEELGALKLEPEEKQPDVVIIIAPKVKQAIKNGRIVETTAKGIPGKSFKTDWENKQREEISPREDLFKSLETGLLSTQYSRFMKLREAISRGLRPNQIVEMPKTMNPLDFPKRRIIGDPEIADLKHAMFATEAWEIENGKVIV